MNAYDPSLSARVRRLAQTASSFPTMGKAGDSAAAVFGVIDRRSVIDSGSSDGARPASVGGDIEFREVAFAYPSRPCVRVLHGLSLKVPARTSMAIVGRRET